MTPTEIATVEDAIQKWKGAGVYIWSYFTSHRQLTLRMQRPGERSNVHLVCTGCSYLQGLPLWAGSDLSFAEVVTSNEHRQYVLQDERGQFRAVFTHVTVELDVAPMHPA